MDLQSWLTWGKQHHGWMDSTRQAYRWRLEHLARWLADRGTTLQTATTEHLLLWVCRTDSLEYRKHQRAAAIAYYRWLVETGQRDDNPAEEIPALRTRKRLPRALSREAFAAVLDATDRRGPMWVALVHLLGMQGLRVTEARTLRWSYVTDDHQRISWTAKGGKERALPLHVQTAQALLAWNRECDDATWIVPSPVHPGQPGSYSWIRRTLRKIGDDAGVATLRPHDLRHTFAVLLLEAGRPIHEVRDLLGHENIATTDIYTHVRQEHLRTAVNSLDVRRAPAPPPPDPDSGSGPRLRLVHNAG